MSCRSAARTQDAIVAALDRHRKFLRGEIAQRINLKFAPEIRFKADQSFDNAARIDALLNSPESRRRISRSRKSRRRKATRKSRIERAAVGRGQGAGDERAPLHPRRSQRLGRARQAVGMTSTQAVSQLKRLFNAKKAGHAGTLDPLASGMLPVAFGEATKTVPFVQDGEKAYRFTVRWGAETDTDDADGKVDATSERAPDARPRSTRCCRNSPARSCSVRRPSRRSRSTASAPMISRATARRRSRAAAGRRSTRSSGRLASRD